ncbi:MAG TPA: long-chain fatty acid--CoA ligase [Acidimicrobiia bacterium]
MTTNSVTTTTTTATTTSSATDHSSLWPPGATILDILVDRVRDQGGRPALRARDEQRHWQVTTWAEFGRHIDEVAAGLHQLGVAAGDRVAILSANRGEWQEADLGILSLGGISVPVYPTSAAPQVAYILADSGSSICFVETAEHLHRVLQQRDELAGLRHIVVFSNGITDDIALNDPIVLSFEHLRALGAQALTADGEIVARARRAVQPDDIATLVYTSGTTGPPKGAVLTHANIMATLRAVTRIVPLSVDDRFLSFLPLSHITERSVSHFGLIAAGGETWFARSISTVAEDLAECHPTVFFAVPRVWEKFREGVEEQVAHVAGARGVLARRYLSHAFARARELEGLGLMPFLEKVEWLALDRVVGAALRRQLGLDRARIVVSGAAPIHPDLLRWFSGIGLPIAEGYGQTEVALVTTLNPTHSIHIGTVGPAVPGVSVRIAPDGEVLVKGENVCRGYWHNETGTHELIDDDGWLHSGDLGALDDHRYLRITGRKKDLIITAHGKNISPQNLETDLTANALVGQAIVIGDGRRYLTALLALDSAAVEHWAGDHGKGTAGIEALAHDPDLHAEIDAIVRAANDRHSHVEHIRKWRILPSELTVASGELTPTLKVKRNIVNERFEDLITEMYADASEDVQPVAD